MSTGTESRPATANLSNGIDRQTPLRLARLIGKISATEESWQQFGDCRGMDPDIFFPEGVGISLDRAETRAKDICNECPVQVACLEYALVHREKYGVWGGATERERKRLIRQRNRTR